MSIITIIGIIACFAGVVAVAINRHLKVRKLIGIMKVMIPSGLGLIKCGDEFMAYIDTLENYLECIVSEWYEDMRIGGLAYDKLRQMYDNVIIEIARTKEANAELQSRLDKLTPSVCPICHRFVKKGEACKKCNPVKPELPAEFDSKKASKLMQQGRVVMVNTDCGSKIYEPLWYKLHDNVIMYYYEKCGEWRIELVWTTISEWTNAWKYATFTLATDDELAMLGEKQDFKIYGGSHE